MTNAARTKRLYALAERLESQAYGTERASNLSSDAAIARDLRREASDIRAAIEENQANMTGFSQAMQGAA